MKTEKRFAVIGDPIKHSLSPLIHEEFSQQTAIDLNYSKICVPAKAFENTVNRFFVGGGSGLNVTMPLKELAIGYADIVSDRAMTAGAANTLTYLNGDIVFGDNTDGAGLVTDLQDNVGFALANSKILVLGAGGAVRGCLGPLLQQSPDAVYLYNRTSSKADQLILHLAHIGKIEHLPDSFDGSLNFDLVINGTSASVSGTQPNIDHRYLQGALCYDMMYGEKSLGFLEWVMAHGAREAHDGMGMLVEQAAESFRVWHDVRPDTADVLEMLRHQFNTKVG